MHTDDQRDNRRHQIQKTGKATGIDAIHAEMLKIDLQTFVGVLFPFFIQVWEREEIPEDWRNGLIVKIPNKGDISVCDNSRGITLLSIPSEVFCRVILNRIRMAVDQRIREEQAGFKARRGCSDQIFALRNIFEQCIEWNAPLFVNLVDFRKACDSIHRDTLWTVMRHYGLPQKIVSPIKLFYERFECGVILKDGVSDFFEVQTGVRQGYMLSLSSAFPHSHRQRRKNSQLRITRRHTVVNFFKIKHLLCIPYQIFRF